MKSKCVRATVQVCTTFALGVTCGSPIPLGPHPQGDHLVVGSHLHGARARVSESPFSPPFSVKVGVNCRNGAGLGVAFSFGSLGPSCPKFMPNFQPNFGFFLAKFGPETPSPSAILTLTVSLTLSPNLTLAVALILTSSPLQRTLSFTKILRRNLVIEGLVSLVWGGGV